jgi:hypothetical protein
MVLDAVRKLLDVANADNNDVAVISEGNGSIKTLQKGDVEIIDVANIDKQLPGRTRQVRRDTLGLGSPERSDLPQLRRIRHARERWHHDDRGAKR